MIENDSPVCFLSLANVESQQLKEVGRETVWPGTRKPDLSRAQYGVGGLIGVNPVRVGTRNQLLT